MWGNEIALRSDLQQVARDAYSVVFEPSRKRVMDHQKAIDSAVAAAILRLAKEEGAEHDRLGCSCGDSMPEGTICPSCMTAPGEAAHWLRKVALQLDAEAETRGNEG
jgi:hypothetical protein